jgi:hypothetical protein
MNVNPAFRALVPVAARETARPTATARTADTAAAEVADAAAAGTASPVRAESLWDVLTPEEREFFARQAELGPVTYGRPRRGADVPQAPLGRRLDVRG